MADEEAIQRKHDLLATAMHYYFWHTGAGFTTFRGCEASSSSRRVRCSIEASARSRSSCNRPASSRRKALLPDRSDDFCGRGVQGFRKENLALHPGHHFGAEKFAAVVEWTVAQTFPDQMQEVESVELKRRVGVIVVLQDVEGGSAGFVEGHNLAVNDAVVRQLRERVCYGRKPGREIIPLARHEPNAPSALYAERPVAVEFDFVFPIRPFRQLRDSQALHRLDEAGRLA